MPKQRCPLEEKHNTMLLSHKQTTRTINSFKKSSAAPNQITIKLIGNAHQNIKDVTTHIDCSQSCREYIQNILLIYSNKIDKLRKQRNLYRQLLLQQQLTHEQQVHSFKAIIEKLEDQINSKKCNPISNCQKCTCFDDFDRRTEKLTEYKDQINQYQFNSQESVPLSLQRGSQPVFKSQTLSDNFSPKKNFELKDIEEDQMLIENSKSNSTQKLPDSLQISDTIKTSTDNLICEEQLVKLMLKYNINVSELEQILEDYDRQYRQADELFDTDNQRELYRLGQRMQRDLWNRKVMKDVKKMSMVLENQP